MPPPAQEDPPPVSWARKRSARFSRAPRALPRCLWDCFPRGLCDDLGMRFGRRGGPRLTCETADGALSPSAATVFALIAEVLVTDALVHGFPPARGGPIAVSFNATQEAWQLTVDDSGIAVRADGDPRDVNLTIALQIIRQVGDGWRFLM